MSGGSGSRSTKVRQRSLIRSDLAVVICTYNGSLHIEEQLISILEQTVLPSRIDVYDDGSVDATLHIVDEVFARRPSAAEGVTLAVHPFDGIRRGAAANFDRGVRETGAELIALADQDDVWHADRLERALDVLDADPAVLLVASNAAFVDGEGRPLGRTTLEAQRLTRDEARALRRRETFAVLTRRNVVPGMTFTVRRRLVESLPPLPRGVMHDYRLALHAAATDRLVVLTTPLVDYRIHGANAIGLDAGDRGMSARFRARWRLIRTALTDLPQWSELVDALERSDPAGHRALADEKLRFERRRRFDGLHGLARIIALRSLMLGDDYRRFDVGGWRGAVKDFLRPRPTDLSA